MVSRYWVSEQLKRDYTDKYVKVDANRPELARFRNVVGQVKTVNMSGRALVEFLDYHLNIGWYDIDLSYLTVVDKPTEESRAAAKAAHEKPAAAPAAKAAKAAAAKPAGAKLSVAEMMAAARGGGGGAKPATPGAPKAKPAETAAAKPKAAAAARPAGGKISVAEMLAAARKAGGTAAPAPAAQEAAAEEPAAAAIPQPAAKAAPAGKVDRSKMSVADMITYCRERDAS